MRSRLSVVALVLMCGKSPTLGPFHFRQFVWRAKQPHSVGASRSLARLIERSRPGRLASRFGWGAMKRGTSACVVFALAALAQATVYYPALLRAMSRVFSGGAAPG